MKKVLWVLYCCFFGSGVFQMGIPNILMTWVFTVTVSLVALLLFVICIAGMFKCLKDRYMRGSGEMMAHFRALVIMALCDVPPPPQTTTEKVDIIPICFNASEFSGKYQLHFGLIIRVDTLLSVNQVQ